MFTPDCRTAEINLVILRVVYRTQLTLGRPEDPIHAYCCQNYPA